MRARTARRSFALFLKFLFAVALLGFIAGLVHAAELEDGEQISAQACAELPASREAFGLAVGDRVLDRATQLVGELRRFGCDELVPVAVVQSGKQTLRARLAGVRRFGP